MYEIIVFWLCSNFMVNSSIFIAYHDIVLVGTYFFTEEKNSFPLLQLFMLSLFVVFQEFELTSSGTIEHANCCEIGTDFFSNDPFDESSSSSFFPPLASFQFSISRHWTFNGKWTIKLKIKSKMKSSCLLHKTSSRFCPLQCQHQIFYQNLFSQDYGHRFILFIQDHIRIHYCRLQKCHNFHHGK